MEGCRSAINIRSHEPRVQERPKQKRRSKDRQPRGPGRDGWWLRRTSPRNEDERRAVRAVISGPLHRARLLEAVPGPREPVHRPPRDGIPDPWLEYLAWRERSAAGPDVARYARLTGQLWRETGLPMLQGIPDPRRPDMRCMCCTEDDWEEKIKKISGSENDNCERIKSRTRKSNGIAKFTPEVGDKTIKKTKSRFEKINRKLSKFDSDLKLKYFRKEHGLREVEKLAELELTDKRKKNRKSEIRDYRNTEEKAYCTDDLCDIVSVIEKKERKTNKKQRKSSRSNLYDADKDNIVQKEKIKLQSNDKRYKIIKCLSSREKTKEKGSSCYEPYGGMDSNFEKINIKDNSKKSSRYKGTRNDSSVKTFVSSKADDLQGMLEKINDRIKITTDVLNSPDLSDEKIPNFEDRSTKSVRRLKKETRKSPENLRKSAYRREIGAGDKEMNSPGSELFFKRRYDISREECSNIPNGSSKYLEMTITAIEALEISDCDVGANVNPCYQKYCYQESSPQMSGNLENENNEQSILQTEYFTD